MELTSRWQDFKYRAGDSTGGATPEKKRVMLLGFFEDAAEEIASVVPEYFPKLLRVATTHRQHLGSDSPLRLDSRSGVQGDVRLPRRG